MSGDGAFVHLVGGEWVEVKTLVLGEVTRTSVGRSACTFSDFRASVMPPALRKQRWSKHIGGGWNGPERARRKMEQSGFKDCSSTTTEQTRSVSWNFSFPLTPLKHVDEIALGRAGRRRQTPCHLAGGRAPPAQTSGTRARPQTPGLVGRSLSQSNHPGETDLLAEAGSTHAVPNVPGRQAGPLVRGVSKVPTRWSLRHG